MNPPTTQSPAAPSAAAPIVCWVGWDWADQQHCVAVRASRTGAPTLHSIEQKPEQLDPFVLNLRAQHPEGRIAVAIEQGRGPVLYALMKYDFLVLYPVNPRTLADYRRAFKLSGAKDDPLDAQLLSELVCLHPERLRPLTVEDAATRQLCLLTEARRTFVDLGTGLGHQLRAALKAYYPLAVELIGEDLASSLAQEFLRRWPNLARLQAARPETLRGFFYAHHSRSEARIEARLEAIQKARPLTEDPALLEPLQLQMLCLVAQMRAVEKSIAQYDRRIAQVFARHSQAPLFGSLPGAGPALAPRLAAVFGTVYSNFPTALNVACFTGVAPVRKQSGGREVAHFRYARPIFPHQSIVEFAKCSIGQCAWARLLYEREIQNGKSRWVAIRKLAFKWLRILWRCWVNHQPYDEVRYLRSLQRRGVELFRPLYEALPPVNNS